MHMYRCIDELNICTNNSSADIYNTPPASSLKERKADTHTQREIYRDRERAHTYIYMHVYTPPTSSVTVKSLNERKADTHTHIYTHSYSHPHPYIHPYIFIHILHTPPASSLTVKSLKGKSTVMGRSWPRTISLTTK